MSDLSQVKVGDTVLSTYGRNALNKDVVKNVTKLHIITEDGTKYRIKSGRWIGSGAWDSKYIEPYDEAVWQAYQERLKLENMRRFCSRVEWWSIDVALLAQVYEILKVNS